MARRGVRKADGEDFSPAKLEEVIKLLNPKEGKPITKKEACERLRMNYNTTRLGKVIDEYLEKKEYAKQRRKQVRKTPISKADVREICSMYLSGDPLSLIVDNTFRSSSVLKRVLLQHNIPLRDASHNYQNPVYLGDDSYAEDYKIGDLVYSAKYGSVAEITNNGKDTKEHGMVYAIQIAGEYERAGYQAAYELADLRELQKEYGVKALYMEKADIINQINITMSKAKKNLAKHGSEF